MSLFEPLFDALNAAEVRYVVVGGFAPVLHGHARLTADIDLIIDLAPDEARKAVETLTRLGFRARAPVDPLAFADATVRRQWIEEKGMRVVEVDLFAEHPIDFEELWNHAEVIKLTRASVRIASIRDLIRLKRIAGRPQDLADIEALELILGHRGARMPGDELHVAGADEWSSGWEARRVEQLILALRATPAQRLAWLEEVIALAYRSGAPPKRRD